MYFSERFHLRQLPVCSSSFVGLLFLVRDQFCITWRHHLARCLQPLRDQLCGQNRSWRQRIGNSHDDTMVLASLSIPARETSLKASPAEMSCSFKLDGSAYAHPSFGKNKTTSPPQRCQVLCKNSHGMKATEIAIREGYSSMAQNRSSAASSSLGQSQRKARRTSGSAKLWSSASRTYMNRA